MEPVKKKQKKGTDGKQAGGAAPVSVLAESLLEACERGASESEVRSLLAAGEVVDIDQADGSGRTALMWACQHGNSLGVVRALITQAHAETDQADQDGRTALWIACREGHLEVARYLVAEAHADVNQADEDGWTPLLIACQEGHLEVVRYLVAEAHAAVNLASNDDRTPLFIAADSGFFGVVRYLASARARLTQLDSEVWQGEQVLHALVQGCQDRLRSLLPSCLEDALVLPPGHGGLEPVLLPLVLEYALPATWEDVQEELS